MIMEEKDFIVNVKKDEVICRAGDESRDLFKIISGKLMICTRNNHMVTPLAYLTADDYFGEFSFFDKQPRSAYIVSEFEIFLFNKLYNLVQFWSEALIK